MHPVLTLLVRLAPLNRLHDPFDLNTRFPWRFGGRKPNQDEYYDADEALRLWLADAFKDEERLQFKAGEVVRFSWGRDNSPIHSEPDFISDRVFMTVLYGSEKELRCMCEWREEEYGKLDEQ